MQQQATAVRLGLIGGSGLGAALGKLAGGKRHEVDTPFGRPSDAVVEAELGGVPVLFLSRHGPGHLIPPGEINYRANLFALKSLGVTHVFASGAVGSLRDEFKPRQLVIPDQVIDKTAAGRRAGTFFDRAAVHVELAEPFCPLLRQTLIDAGTQLTDSGGGASADLRVHARGTYVCMEGPVFSTRAESLMHRLWGGDLIGMTAMPEAKLAREAEMAYALVALVTDYDSWKPQVPPTPKKPAEQANVGEPASAGGHPSPDAAALLKEILANLESATASAIELLRRAAALAMERAEQLAASPARDALKLAIWSDKSSVPREEVERLKVIWGRHFEG